MPFLCVIQFISLLLIKKIRTSATRRPAPASDTTQSRRDWDSSEAGHEAGLPDLR